MIIASKQLKDLANEKITFVIGTFDILHPGHIHFLEKAKELGGGKLLVAVLADETVRERKGPERPVCTQGDRAEVLDALRVVDYVYMTPLGSVSEVSRKILETVRPENAVASRDDWGARKEEWLTAGTELILIDKIPERSTTKIVQKIRK